MKRLVLVFSPLAVLAACGGYPEVVRRPPPDGGVGGEGGSEESGGEGGGEGGAEERDRPRSESQYACDPWAPPEWVPEKNRWKLCCAEDPACPCEGAPLCSGQCGWLNPGNEDKCDGASPECALAECAAAETWACPEEWCE